MFIETRHFGRIEVDEEGIINFEEGLPGFEDVKKFIILGTDDTESPFKWLQCVDKPDLAFAVINPFAIRRDYCVDIHDNIAGKLGIEDPSSVIIYSIVVVPEDISRISMNLKAPVIINAKNNKAAQVILDTDAYSVRHYIIDELQKQEDAGNACTVKEKGPVHCNR